MNERIFLKKSILNPAHDDFDRLIILAGNLRDKGISEATRKAYLSDFASFADFCIAHDRSWMPADDQTVSAYLSSIITKRYASISRAVVSIRRYHLEAGHQSPTDSQSVKALLKGIRREIGIACDSSEPILWDEIKRMVVNCDRSIRGRRNQAILMIGWSAALRRSEIVALDVEDIGFISEGMTVEIRKSKTDQESEGRTLFIPKAPPGELCVPTFFESYRELLFLNEAGPLFRRVRRNNDRMFYDWGNSARLSEQTVTDIVKDAARSIGLNPLHYSSHSLRRGFATQCGRLGIPERFIARHTRHSSMAVLRRYIDDGSILINNPLNAIYSAAVRDRARPQELPDHDRSSLPEESGAALSLPPATVR